MRHSQLTGPGAELAQAHRWPPLVAVAHGSADPRAAATITALLDLASARAGRAGLRGLQVRAAYLGHALPSVPDVLAAVHGACPAHTGSPGPPCAVVLPLLLTGAYHSDTDLPAVLAAAGRRLPGLRVSYGEPLGPHPWLLRSLEGRLTEAGVPAAPASRAGTAIVLAAAGSSRPSARGAVARLAASWQSGPGWHAVVPAYASASAPTPAQAVAGLLRAGASRVAVATYLLAPGAFADQIREQSLAAGAAAVSAPLGAAPDVADVIIERYLRAFRGAPRGHAAGLRMVE